MKSLSRLELETIVRGIPAAVLVIEKATGVVTYANDNATTLFGSKLTGLVVPHETEKLHVRFFSLTGQPYVLSELPTRKALAEGTEVNAEFIVERPDSSRVVVRGLAKPVKDNNGNVIAAVGIFEDITERKNSEEVLKENEEKFRGLVESTSDIIWQVDKNAVYTYVSPKVKDILGYDPEEVVGKTPFDLVDEGDEEKILNAFLEIANKKEPFYGLQNCNVHKNGSRVLLETSGVPILDGNRQLAGYRGIDRDITERKKAEEALRESEGRFKIVAEVAKVLVYEIKTETQDIVIFRGEDVLGYGPGEIPTNEDWWLSQIHAEDRAETLSKLRQATATGSDYSIEYRIKCKQGNYIFAHDTGKAVLNKQGKVIGFVGGMRDVTERKKWENELKRQQSLLQTVLDNLPIGVMIADTTGKALMLNKAMESIWAGKKPLEDFNRYGQYLAWDSKTNKRVGVNDWPVSVAIRTGSFTDDYEFVIKRFDGTKGMMLTKAVPIRLESGGLMGAVGVSQDITKRKQMERQLIQYSRELETLVEERTKQLQEKERLATIGATAGMVGHDIRNPLQAISGDLYLLKDCLSCMPENEIKSEVIESLDGIEKNVGYINKIVLDLQDYSRPLTPECSVINLAETIGETLKAVDIPDNIKVVNKTEYIELRTDAQFIRRALTNLINNAVQAMPTGGNLTIEAYEKEMNAILSVEDTGVGIPEEVKPKLFTPMLTTKAKGQGLGLAVVKRLVEALGGTITFESEKGKGTKFIIKLPAIH